MKKTFLLFSLISISLVGFCQSTYNIEIDDEKLDSTLMELKNNMRDLAANIQDDIVNMVDEMELEKLVNDSEGVFANMDGSDYKYSKEKHFEKEFSVSANANLTLDNRFGDIIVHTWDKNVIKISVDMNFKANKQDIVDRLYSTYEIDCSKVGNKVSASTTLDSSASKNINSSCDIEINYTVYVPDDVKMNLINKYGDISLDDVNKDLDVDLRFGDFAAKQLKAKSDIEVSYGDVEIASAKDLDLNLSFCDDSQIGDVQNLVLKMKYSDISCQNITTANIDAQFSEVDAESVKNLILDSHYSEVTLRTLASSLDADISFGDLKIKKVNADFGAIDITASYTDVVLTLDKNINFYYDLSTTYDGINTKAFDLEKHATKLRSENNKKSLEGCYGQPNEGQKILIKATYSDIKLDK